MDIERKNGTTKAEEDRSETSRSKKKHCRRSDTAERATRGRASPREIQHTNNGGRYYVPREIAMSNARGYAE